MKYKLYSKLDMNSLIYLIDKGFLYKILSDFNDENELLRIKTSCTKDPKESWITKSDPLNIFDVPLLSTDFDYSLCINQGRHRICWMISQGMNDIPIAVSPSALKLISNYPIIKEYDMPCSLVPSTSENNESLDTKNIVEKTISILRKKK